MALLALLALVATSCSARPADSRSPTLSTSEPFRVTPVRPIAELRAEALAASPPSEVSEARVPSDLVELRSLEPSIALDIRYATTNNFLGERIYDEPRAFLQRPAAEALARVHRALERRGLGLLVHDAYRPWYVTKILWEATPPDKHAFVANPAKGSRHNRGCAVDLTLFRRDTGAALEMPSAYDEMTERAKPSYSGGTEEQRARRDLLRAAMEAEGFQVNEVEWWHFDYRDWNKYAVENVAFDKVGQR